MDGIEIVMHIQGFLYYKKKERIELLFPLLLRNKGKKQAILNNFL